MKNLLNIIMVALVITTFNACAQKDSTTVIVKEYESCCGLDPVVVTINKSTLYIPNVFTPNGDGVNDRFIPVTNQGIFSIADYYLTDTAGVTLYNRTVLNLIDGFEDNAWNGIDNNGKPYKGSFNYYFTVVTKAGEAKFVKGKACSIVCGPDASVFKTKDGCYYSTQATKDGTLDKTIPNKESDCFK